MNLIRGGRFAPSLELKPLVSIETHPPTLLSLSQGWLEDADALHLKPWLEGGTADVSLLAIFLQAAAFHYEFSSQQDSPKYAAQLECQPCAKHSRPCSAVRRIAHVSRNVNKCK